MTRSYRPKAGFWMRLCVLVIYPLDSVLFKLRWQHPERIPATGGVLVAINHISQLDPLATGRMVWQAGRIPQFLIKSTLFTIPVVGAVLHRAGQIPVYRGTSDATLALQSAIDALRRGQCVIIYPEGTITRDPDYWPMTAKTGVARLALACPDVPVIPVGQWGAQQSLDRTGRFRPRPRRLHRASIGEPVELTGFHGGDAGPDALREITAEIMRAITVEVAALRGA